MRVILCDAYTSGDEMTLCTPGRIVVRSLSKGIKIMLIHYVKETTNETEFAMVYRYFTP